MESLSPHGEGRHQVGMVSFGVKNTKIHLCIFVTLRAWWWQSSGKATFLPVRNEDVLFPSQLKGGGSSRGRAVLACRIGWFCCPPSWCPPQLGECHSPRSFGTKNAAQTRTDSLSLLCPRYNLLPRIIEAKYLDAMDAEYWRQQGQPLRGWKRRGNISCSFLSPLSSCSDVGNALLSQLHGACARPREPWAGEDDALWSCEANKLYGKCSFSTSPTHTNPKDQPGCTVWSIQSCPVFPLFEGGGIFLMHQILLFPNTKNSNWPLFCRTRALWPGLWIQFPVHPAFPNWCSGWDGLVLNHWCQERLWLFSQINGFGNSCSVYCYNAQPLDEFLIPANELGILRSWPCGRNPIWVWAVWELVGIFSPISPGWSDTELQFFAQLQGFFACTQRAVVSRLHIHMYSSAYVYIYTYGVVYIFCIDIQIGLVLSKYHKCFCAVSVNPPRPDHILVLCFSAAFSHLRDGHFDSFGSCSVTGFVSRVALFKVFSLLSPSLWLETFIILSRGSNMWIFPLVLMYRMQWKFSSFLLINICWSFHCFCCVADFQFHPTPERYIIFLDESQLLLSFIFQFI